MVVRHSAQAAGEREGDQKVGDRQQQGLLLRQPGLGRALLAGRTVAVATGVVAIASSRTGRTAVDMAAEYLGSTLFNRTHGCALIG